jgi:hypothetical protein
LHRQGGDDRQGMRTLSGNRLYISLYSGTTARVMTSKHQYTGT